MNLLDVLNAKLNRTDFLFIGIYAIIFLLINGYENALNFDTTKYIFPDGQVIQNISPPLKGYFIATPVELICTFSVLFSLFLWVIPKFLIRHKNYILFFVLSLLIAIVFGAISYSTWFWAENKPWQTFSEPLELIIAGLGLTVRNVGLPLGILLAKKYYESQINLAQLQKQQKESELKLLQAQLDPHFLFNNLNTLDALIAPSSSKAKEYIANLSSLYRYVIETKDETVVPLVKEVEMVKHYFKLIGTRFGDAYVLSIIDKSANISNAYVPTGALQIIAENVIKHNIVEDEKSIETHIEIGDSLVIIKNTKTTPIDEVHSFKTGLQNVKERYKLIFDKTIVIEESQTEYKVTIPIIPMIDN